MPVTMSQANA